MSSDGAAGSGESDLKERLRRSGIVAVFAVTQLFGWASTYSTHAILARPIADDLSITLTEAVTGSSAFLISMAFASQLAGRLYRTVGAARLMAAGSLFMAFALSMVAVSNSLVTYFAAWLLVGIAGAAILTTSAHTVLVTVLGRSARPWIAGLMLISGLSSSLGYPMSAALESWVGWRDTYLLYALLHGVLCLPLHLLVCRLVGREKRPDSGDAAAVESTSRRDRILFLNLAIAISLLGVVTWGFTIVVVELFVSLRIPHEEAVALAASIGIFQITARLMEFLFAGGRSPIRTGLEAAVLMALGFLFFSLTDATAKYLTEDFSAFQIAWFRQFGLLSVALWFLARRGLPVLRTRRPVLQVLRGSAAALSATGFIFAVSYVPLTDAVAVTIPDGFTVDVVRSTGVKISLDRCKASAGLGALRVLPIDFVKVHDALVRRMTVDPIDRAHLDWIREAAAQLGVKTIATGVEQDDWLRELGTLDIDYAQGVRVNKIGPLMA